MGNKRAGGVSLALLALTLAGCAHRPQPLPTVQTGPALRITLAMQPPRPRQLDPTVFTVRLKDAQGRPVTRADIAVELTMPTMDMGRNDVPVKFQSPGVYSGTGRFTMAGDWRITIAAAHGPSRSVQSFPVSVQ